MGVTQTVRWWSHFGRQVLRDPPWAAPGDPLSPVPSRDDVARAMEAAPPVEGVDLNEAEQLELMTRLSDVGWEVADRPTAGWRFHVSPYFGPVDAAVYQSLLRTSKPARIVEVGSGFTSALALDARDRWLPDVDLTFIDPNPARLDSLLGPGDEGRCQIFRQPVQDVDLSLFDRLGAGDILFCDTDHFVKTGSEVNWLVFNVLPRLRRGVIVHIHDVFWPFEYSQEWLGQRRAYNEVYLVRAFLMYNAGFSMMLFNDWLWQHHRHLFHGLAEWTEPPGSLWLRKVA